MRFMDLVQTKRELSFRVKNLNICMTCTSYVKNNNRHGTCLLYEADTCAEASCRKYKYIYDKETIKL